MGDTMTTYEETNAGRNIKCDNQEIYCDSQEYYCDGSVAYNEVEPE